MQTPLQPSPEQGRARPSHPRWPWLILAVVLVVAIAIFIPRPERQSPAAASTNAPTSLWKVTTSSSRYSRAVPPRWHAPPGLTAEEVVTNKLNQFVRNRRELLHKMAEQFKAPVPAEYQRFFDVLDAGDWNQVTNLFEALNNSRDIAPEARRTFWPLLMETYGVADIVHQWPAQQLLDYGQAVLGSLRPDMVYVGGTDPGRFIPTLLNETSEGDRHMVLTQNALADASYLQYLQFLYGDRLSVVAAGDSQKAFMDYTADAQKRLLHDQQFPNEPKQIRPGEDIRNTDGRVQVSGQLAVMAINENLFRMLMERNPNLSFAIEESFPFKSTYADASVLGPIMELGVKDGQNALTPERAAESVDYWRAMSLQLSSGGAADDLTLARQAYAKMAAGQARLLLDRNYAAQAEEDLRIANQICPWSPEVIFSYVQLLTQQGRFADATAVAENAVKAAPDNPQIGNLLEQLRKLKRN